MQKKSIALFVVCGLVAAMFCFSLGILASRPAQAQPIYSKLSNLPRQSELWSVSAQGPDDWLYVPGVISGHVFTVQRDQPLNRLPVLTAIHGDIDPTGDPVARSINLYREINGQWERWEVGDYTYHRNSGNTGAGWATTEQVESRFHQSAGVVLQPGRYLVSNVFRGEMSHELLVSGYWALP